MNTLNSNVVSLLANSSDWFVAALWKDLGSIVKVGVVWVDVCLFVLLVCLFVGAIAQVDGHPAPDTATLCVLYHSQPREEGSFLAFHSLVAL